MSVSHDPNFREQYAGGLRPDPEVEAALSGQEYITPQTRPVTQSRPSLPSQFGEMVKLG